MRIAYLKIRNLDSHERKALSYWIGGGVILILTGGGSLYPRLTRIRRPARRGRTARGRRGAEAARSGSPSPGTSAQAQPTLSPIQ